MTCDNDGLYWLLNTDKSAVSQARTLAWEALARLGLDVGLVDDGVAIVSELVANAVVHGRPPVELQLRPGCRGVKLLVIDRGTGEPKDRPANSQSPGGRGLFVVSAYSGENWGTAPAAYRSIANLDGKAVWAVLPGRPRQLDDLEPEPAARLLQRWLERRGLRDVVVSPPAGRSWLVSVAGGCAITCCPGKLAWRTDDGIHRVFAYRELPDAVDHLCRWSSAAGERARRGPPESPRTAP
jgi:anti-sigma regulatory factor (Ser/Thr protein kinase)